VFLAKILFYFTCLYLVFRFYGVLIELRYKQKPRIPGDLGLQSDVIEQCTQIIAISAAILLALVIAGVDFSSLGIFAGLLAAGLSVAMKDVLGNVVSGVLLLWGKTIKANDVITIPRSESSDTGATYGVVRRMTMRYTIVEDRNEVRRLIPNSKLTDNTIENWTHEDRSVRLRVLVDVDYDTDLRLARTLLESVCYEVPKIDTRKQPPKAVVIGFGASAIHMSLRFWVNEPHKGIRPVLSDVYIAIVERFRDEDIKIPFPQLELHVASPVVAD
jgi:small-conductance mechanosensitive channel